jgi:hypothetical protein
VTPPCAHDNYQRAGSERSGLYQRVLMGDTIVKKTMTALAAIALSASSPAFADIVCQGVVNTVMVSGASVFVNFGYNRLLICNIDSSISVTYSSGNSGMVTPAQCQVLLSEFTTAMATGKQVTAVSTRSDCNFTDGAMPNPYPYQYYFYNH